MLSSPFVSISKPFEDLGALLLSCLLCVTSFLVGLQHDLNHRWTVPKFLAQENNKGNKHHGDKVLQFQKTRKLK